MVEYDGTRYAGFQVQTNARTVAGELLAAVRAAVGEPVTLSAAGRTDAGVHAGGQVVSFLCAKALDPRTLREAVNDRLPADVNVLDASPAPPGFHARRSALSRAYRYQVSTRRDAFRKRFVWWVRSPLDLGRLEGEARAIAGFHDFASFTDVDADRDADGPGPPAEHLGRGGGGEEAGADTSVRVAVASWTRAGDLLLFHVTAERFLYRMVRRLVGAMVEVGLGKEPPGLVARLLAEPRGGAAAAWTAPPSGLFLESVTYPPEPRPRGR